MAAARRAPSAGAGRAAAGRRRHASAKAAPLRPRRQPIPVRYLSAVIWAFLVWNLLTWTATVENLAVGLGVALAVAAAIAAAGTVIPPWRLLDPRRLAGIVWLIAVVSAGIMRENVKLARRIWLPSRPLASGMVIAPTAARTDGEIAAVGLLTSLVVDNQVIDIDRSRHLLQFHGVALPPPGRQHARAAINGPVERPLLFLSRR